MRTVHNRIFRAQFKRKSLLDLMQQRGDPMREYRYLLVYTGTVIYTFYFTKIVMVYLMLVSSQHLNSIINFHSF